MKPGSDLQPESCQYSEESSLWQFAEGVAGEVMTEPPLQEHLQVFFYVDSHVVKCPILVRDPKYHVSSPMIFPQGCIPR